MQHGDKAPLEGISYHDTRMCFFENIGFVGCGILIWDLNARTQKTYCPLIAGNFWTVLIN